MTDRRHEPLKLFWVEMPSRANARADIHTIRTDLRDRLADILSVQTTCQKDRFGACFNNLARERPIMRAPGSAQFRRVGIWSTGIEKKRMHMRFVFRNEIQRAFVFYMNDLYAAR